MRSECGRSARLSPSRWAATSDRAEGLWRKRTSPRSRPLTLPLSRREREFLSRRRRFAGRRDLDLRRSVPVFEVGRPVFGDRVPQAAAHVDRAILFGHAPGVEVLADFLDGTTVVLDAA